MNQSIGLREWPFTLIAPQTFDECGRPDSQVTKRLHMGTAARFASQQTQLFGDRENDFVPKKPNGIKNIADCANRFYDGGLAMEIKESGGGRICVAQSFFAEKTIQSVKFRFLWNGLHNYINNRISKNDLIVHHRIYDRTL